MTFGGGAGEVRGDGMMDVVGEPSRVGDAVREGVCLGLCRRSGEGGGVAFGIILGLDGEDKIACSVIWDDREKN